jgi:ABC-type multidrug transport system fused ATPase/permease subunit
LDEIIVLERGEIAARGTQEALLKAEGLFRYMLVSQNRLFVS